ncbi:MAG: putative toxin-antitoxin system toxin component, PIN family [Nitrospirae bacterium]|uniref:PIN domain-containing protein n=1 Tax=uncultured Nitrospirota bacterium TaxID=170969 RepID=A0A142BTT8_9BACT|nr:hypothetical protein [uncultured Nitrospirota bacterium]MBF0328617.1 putative toxin-antitoxin system toxin component, PIN family [Nitrospirota bacterium]
MNIVLDTNVLVAGLLSPFGGCGEIVRMVSAGELTLYFDARILSEYDEVLRRPKFKFEEKKVADLLDYIKLQGKLIAALPLKKPLPDSDDEAFLEVAISSKTSCLVTGNQNHFPSELCEQVKVLSPKEFFIFYKKQKHIKTKHSGTRRKKTRTR